MGVAFSASCELFDKFKHTSEVSSIEEPIVINTTKDALIYLNTKKNYTFTYEGDYLIPHSYHFTENAIGRTMPTKKTMNHYYCSDENGTYEIEYDITHDNYVTSEYRLDKNVWDSKLTFNYLNVGTSFLNKIENDAQSVLITNVEYKRVFVQMLGYSPDDFLSIDTLIANYNKETSVLTYKCLVGKRYYTYHVTDFGTSTISEFENIDPNAFHAYTPVSFLSNARDKIFSNNYIQGIYMFSESGSGYVGNYIFNKHYFGQTYNTSNDMTGYISLHCDAQTTGTNTHPALKGCYFFNITNYATDATPKLNSNPISTNLDITEVMNYPSHLLLWKNLQKFISWTGTTTETVSGRGFYTEDADLVNDFSVNFNMDGAFEGQKPYAIGLDIDITESKDDSVTFYYYFKYGSQIKCYPVPFYRFGEANVKVLDQIYNTYHTIND